MGAKEGSGARAAEAIRLATRRRRRHGAHRHARISPHISTRLSRGSRGGARAGGTPRDGGAAPPSRGMPPHSADAGANSPGANSPGARGTRGSIAGSACPEAGGCDLGGSRRCGFFLVVCGLVLVTVVCSCVAGYFFLVRAQGESMPTIASQFHDFFFDSRFRNFAMWKPGTSPKRRQCSQWIHNFTTRSLFHNTILNQQFRELANMSYEEILERGRVYMGGSTCFFFPDFFS